MDASFINKLAKQAAEKQAIRGYGGYGMGMGYPGFSPYFGGGMYGGHGGYGSETRWGPGFLGHYPPPWMQERFGLQNQLMRGGVESNLRYMDVERNPVTGEDLNQGRGLVSHGFNQPSTAAGLGKGELTEGNQPKLHAAAETSHDDLMREIWNLEEAKKKAFESMRAAQGKVRSTAGIANADRFASAYGDETMSPWNVLGQVQKAVAGIYGAPKAFTEYQNAQGESIKAHGEYQAAEQAYNARKKLLEEQMARKAQRSDQLYGDMRSQENELMGNVAARQGAQTKATGAALGDVQKNYNASRGAVPPPAAPPQPQAGPAVAPKPPMPPKPMVKVNSFNGINTMSLDTLAKLAAQARAEKKAMQKIGKV